jgi:hypothetical protein
MTKKLNQKAIAEKTRQECAKKYSDRINWLTEELRKERELKVRALHRNYELARENEELKEKVRAHEEWIERLQDFVNMDEDTRKEEIRKYNESAEVKRIFDTLMTGPFGQLFAGLY